MKKIVLLFTALFALSLFSCSNSSGSDSGSSGGGEPQVADWLFLLYMDGDDSAINDELYANMREVEWALAQIRNADGSPKTGYPSIKVVALWDGVGDAYKANQKYTQHPKGALYELGPDYELKWIQYSTQVVGPTYYGEIGKVYLVQEADGSVNLGPEFKMGKNTKDLTSTAGDWMGADGEPKMGEESTLEGFLKWAKSRYSAKNVVIALDDHGAGTHRETYSDSNGTSKSTCADVTSGDNKLLTCKNIKDALTNAGYVGDAKPKILWHDVCFQATAEIVYNLKGCAEYLSASPNESICNVFSRIFTSIKTGYTALDVGKVIASAYHEYKSLYNENYNEFKDCLSSGCSMFTWSFFSLDEQKVNALKTAVDNFAVALHSIYDADQTSSTTNFNNIYQNCVKQNKANLAECKGLSYGGTYAFLNDLGWLAKEVKANNDWAVAHESAGALLDLLKNGDDKLIVYAWGGKRAASVSNGAWSDITAKQMYLTGQKDFITGKAVDVEFNDDYYGMTIVAGQRNAEAAADAVQNYYDWTGFSEEWGKVINQWRISGL